MMLGSGLGLTAHSGLAQVSLVLESQRLLELAALAPQSPQTGALLLDTALEIFAATQAGLLLTLPACFELAASTGLS